MYIPQRARASVRLAYKRQGHDVHAALVRWSARLTYEQWRHRVYMRGHPDIHIHIHNHNLHPHHNTHNSPAHRNRVLHIIPYVFCIMRICIDLS